MVQHTFDPWSARISKGTPNLEMNWSTAVLATNSALWLGNDYGCDSNHFVYWSIIIKMYCFLLWFLVGVLECLNAPVPLAFPHGNRPSGAFRCFVGFLLILHMCRIGLSLDIRDQRKLRLTLSNVFSWPRCHDTLVSWQFLNTSSFRELFVLIWHSSFPYIIHSTIFDGKPVKTRPVVRYNRTGQVQLVFSSYGSFLLPVSDCF